MPVKKVTGALAGATQKHAKHRHTELLHTLTVASLYSSINSNSLISTHMTIHTRIA